MKKLTLKSANELALKYFAKLKNTEWDTFTPMHSKEVAEMAKTLAERLGVDAQTVEIAGILHDIGYAEGKKEGHAERSLEYIQMEGFEVSETLKDCILNHSHNMNPKTIEGKIIQLSDKASSFNPKLIYLLLDYGKGKDGKKGKVLEEDLKFLEKVSRTTIELLKKFEY